MAFRISREGNWFYLIDTDTGASRAYPGFVEMELSDNNSNDTTDITLSYEGRTIATGTRSDFQDSGGVTYASFSAFFDDVKEIANFEQGGGGFTIDQNHFFADNTARDTYFDTPDPHLDELVSRETIISVGAGFQRWDGTTNPGSYVNTNWTTITGLVTGPAGSQGTQGPAGPAGSAGSDGADGTFTDREITTNLTLNTGNLSTYNRANIINRGTSGGITVTLDTITNFVAGPTSNVVFRFVQDTDSATFTIQTSGLDVLGRGGSSLSLERGQSLTIKLPVNGNRWVTISAPATTTTAPIAPPPTTRTDGDVILQDTPAWDASAGSFPSGSRKGYLYQNSGGAGTIDNQFFGADDLIMSLVDNASTSTYVANWQIIEGDSVVHSWGGLTGIIDDNNIRTVLSRLGITSGGSTVSALSNFVLNDIPSRIGTAVSLAGDHSVSFTMTDPEQFTALDMEMNNIAVHDFTLASLQEGSNTVTDVNISAGEWSAITTGGITSIPFQLVGTVIGGGKIRSNIVTVERRDLEEHEFFYHGRASSTADPTSIDISTLTSIELGSVAGQQITFNIPTGSDNDKIILLAPANRDLTELVNTDSGFSVLNTFTKVVNDRVINSENFDSYELDSLRAAFTANYRATL